MLHDRDATTLARIRGRQRRLLIAGVLLFALGTAYMLWAVDRLHGTPAAMETEAFDRPVAALARRVSAQQERLSHMQPMTRLERAVVEELRAQADLNGRLLLLVLRLLAGSIVVTVGLALLAMTFAQRPLLSIIRRLRI